MSFHPTQSLLANGHQAQAVIDALEVRISVLETMLVESVDNTFKYRLEMESLKRAHEEETTALRNTNAELLRELCFYTSRGSPADDAQPPAEAVQYLVHQLTGTHHHVSPDQPEAAGSSGPERK
jgi:hypothetical protein